MKVLLIQPSFSPNIIGAGIVSLNEPLALETIAACIPYHDVEILDMRLEPNLKRELNNFQPDIVGITAYTPNVYTATKILKEVKKYSKDILTVIGGHHATLLPQDFNRDFIDVIIIGEGQYSFQELVDAYERKDNLARIDGLALHDKGELFFTQPRPAIANLDDTPLPSRNLTKQYRDKYFRASWRPLSTMVSSRGCPYRCNFCSVWKHEHGKYRTRSAERVVNELMSIKENYVYVADDNFFQDTERAERIYEMIKQHDIKKSYRVVCRSDVVVCRPDIIEKWKGIGMENVTIGIESFRDDDLQALNKRSSVNDNSEAIRILHENQVTVSAHFIINPDYTREDFDALTEYVKRMKLTQPVFCVLTPLPGTDLFEEKKDQLLTHNYEVFDLIHAVLPTRLPQEEFYRHYANLYRTFYLSESTEKGKDNLIPKTIIDQISSYRANVDTS